ncbi:hypothetical protein [Aliikangiella coralliicola]|uniref:Uncharacterized protein n=1 Tax=Aliikangiella coralliicola TaxID=2592383 RepID=A0A545UIZ2_9GAMM|nr:hypothetical protein [Aliikangiella coralliicola]TQV89432.1 hypothetical protein FLL46_00690 [Aliikangiella coralliicola]
MAKNSDNVSKSIEEALAGIESSSNNIPDIAFLLAVKNMQTISHDTEMFLRNNHLVYTATVGAAMKKLIEGEQSDGVETILENLDRLLNNNKEYYADMNSICVKMLVDIQGLKSEK